MAARENLPRLVREVQDITSRLYEEFSSTGDPITDDNHVLHRLCVKLEYLLQSSMKEKSLLGGTKSYWHWMYDSLKRTKGLSDGLKYVRANKEVRTSQGRGRALIRYSLVHQTLADSFQNCLMNDAICSQYLKTNCLLVNPTYGRSFVNALYELNAVNFDLISKGYDLDAAWPTFASKRYSSSVDQWRPPGRSSSLGSLNSMVSHITSTSIVMDTPQLRGVRSGGSFIGYDPTGSNGTPSVDHRVEELVLELDQSDQKIKEQQDALSRLECDAQNMAKSAVEKEDILARVISDLESRNQNLQDAMGNMSTEFQNRESSWENKHMEASSLLLKTKEENETLKGRIAMLEQDKRNLEDTVSARMSQITSGFSGTNNTYAAASTPTDYTERGLASRLAESKKEQNALEKQLYQLRLELASVTKKIESEKEALCASLTAEFEAKESEWSNRLENASANATTQLVLKLSTLLPEVSDEFTLTTRSPLEQVDYVVSKLTEMANEFSSLRQATMREDQSVQQSSDNFDSNDLLDKYETVVSERDDALAEVADLHNDLVAANKELQNSKLKLEAVLSKQQHTAVELKDRNFQLEDEISQEKQLKSEALGNARKWQTKPGQDGTDALHSCSSQPTDPGNLASELAKVELEKNSLKGQLLARQNELDDLCLSTKKVEETLSRVQKQLEETRTLKYGQDQKILSLEDEIQELKEKDENSEAFIKLIQQQMQEINETLQTTLEEKDQAVQDVERAKSELVEELHHANTELELSLKSKIDTLENMEKQHRLLAGNLAMKEKELSATNFQLDAVKSCMEEERLKSRKEYDELFGENESRKRMIKSFENKVEAFEKENRDLVTKISKMQKLETELKSMNEKNNELTTSSKAIEEEFIKVVQKLEEEREGLTNLKDEISEGVSREQGLKNEITDLNSVISDLKVKLIQLLQEKDALWKECDELRYFQKLQEEGEETEGKWMEDQEARYCLHCGTQFSFIVRKHHCRLCGKIFCNDCSKQWIITKTDGKHERCCLNCLELHKNKNEIKLLEADVKKTSDTPGMSRNETAGSEDDCGEESEVGYETITDEELKDATQADSIYDEHSPSKSSVDDSIYSTPNAKLGANGNFTSSDNLPHAMAKEKEHPKGDKSKKAVVNAGESLRLPIVVKSPGTTLFWKFSTDRSIDFQLSYCHEEGEDEQPLIQRCRCNSHSEPIEGELLSKKPGIYILEFDNKFSRFMSKEVSYTLRVNDEPVA